MRHNTTLNLIAIYFTGLSQKYRRIFPNADQKADNYSFGIAEKSEASDVKITSE